MRAVLILASLGVMGRFYLRAQGHCVDPQMVNEARKRDSLGEIPLSTVGSQELCPPSCAQLYNRTHTYRTHTEAALRHMKILW